MSSGRYWRIQCMANYSHSGWVLCFLYILCIPHAVSLQFVTLAWSKLSAMAIQIVCHVVLHKLHVCNFDYSCRSIIVTWYVLINVAHSPCSLTNFILKVRPSNVESLNQLIVGCLVSAQGSSHQIHSNFYFPLCQNEDCASRYQSFVLRRAFAKLGWGCHRNVPSNGVNLSTQEHTHAMSKYLYETMKVSRVMDIYICMCIVTYGWYPWVSQIACMLIVRTVNYHLYGIMRVGIVMNT